jgi:hypothetical protein
MTLGDLVARMADRLERAGIPYMVTGSLASSFHGEPRTTRDVDLVIDPTPQALTAFVGRLPASEFSVDADAARVALQERRRAGALRPQPSSPRWMSHRSATAS